MTDCVVCKYNRCVYVTIINVFYDYDYENIIDMFLEI